MRIQRHHLLLGLFTAALLHVGVALVFALQPSPPDNGAQSAGIGGVEISLGPAGGAPGEATPLSETTDAETLEAEDVSTVETVEAIAQVETGVVEAIEEPLERPSAEEIVAQQPVPVAKVEPREPLQTPEVVRQPPIQPESPAPTVTTSAPEKETKPTPTASVSSGTSGQAGTRNQQATGSQQAASAGGSPAARTDYINALRAWLEQHKQYPRRARIRRQQGTAVLRFTMNREGRVMSYRIESSSGYSMLDQEVEAMIERAQPLPVMPEDMQQASLELVLPVQFFLR